MQTKKGLQRNISIRNCQNAALGNIQKAIICINYSKAHQKVRYTDSNCTHNWISIIKSSNCKSTTAEVMSEKPPFQISSCYPYQINQSSHCMFMRANAFTRIKSTFCHGSLDKPELFCEHLRKRIKGQWTLFQLTLFSRDSHIKFQFI